MAEQGKGGDRIEEMVSGVTSAGNEMLDELADLTKDWDSGYIEENPERFKQEGDRVDEIGRQVNQLDGLVKIIRNNARRRRSI